MISWIAINSVHWPIWFCCAIWRLNTLSISLIRCSCCKLVWCSGVRGGRERAMYRSIELSNNWFNKFISTCRMRIVIIFKWYGDFLHVPSAQWLELNHEDRDKLGLWHLWPLWRSINRNNGRVANGQEVNVTGWHGQTQLRRPPMIELDIGRQFMLH